MRPRREPVSWQSGGRLRRKPATPYFDDDAPLARACCSSSGRSCRAGGDGHTYFDLEGAARVGAGR